MGLSVKKLQRNSDEVAQLTAQIESLKGRLEALEGHAQDQKGADAPHSRRDLLKLAGAAAAGAAGTIVLRSIPAAAVNTQPIILGNETTNDAATTTDIFPTDAAAPSPLFQATGQGVSTTLTVPPTTSTTGAPVQSIPLIGAVGPSGTLPLIGNPPVRDYPGFAPIQGVGGVTTITTSNGTEVESEGLNGWGGGANGKGVTGESDIGYGVLGGSGGIDLAAGGNGRIMQLPLPSGSLSNSPAGPPNYNNPNDFEQVRDLNGVLYLSLPGGTWIPVQSGGLNQALFTAVTTKLLALKNNDGSTFVDMMPDNSPGIGLTGGPDLVLSITPLFDCLAILTGNASLYTATPGYNQDMGIYVSPSSASQNIVAWEEAGQGNIQLPNAAVVQTVFPMTRGTTYDVRLKWKTNIRQASGAIIRSGAGPFPRTSGLTSVSPTRLTALLIVNP